MDDKGRILIPAPFRKVLAQGATGPQVELILVYGAHLRNHAQGYSAQGFERIEERIDAMPESDARTALETFVIGCSRTITVDESGRIVLPRKVRQICQLPEAPERGQSTPIHLLGRVNKFTLWREDIYDEVHGAGDTLAKVPPGQDILKLLDNPNAFGFS